jgi:amino acid adenylation domain-containing protein
MSALLISSSDGTFMHPAPESNPRPRPAGPDAARVSTLQATGERFVQLSTDHERSSTPDFEAAWSAWVRLAPSTGELERARQGQLAGALCALLYRHTQQANIALDVFVHDRSGEKRTAVDFAVDGDTPVSSAVAEARVVLAAAKAPHPGRLSNVAATFVLAPLEDESSLDMGACVATPGARYDIHFVLAQTRAATLVAVAYNAKLILSSSVHRLMESYVVLLQAAFRDPTMLIDRLPLLSQGELRALTIEQDDRAAPDPPVPVHRVFEAIAKRQPAALAASFGRHRLTYGELDERSSQLAHHLLACGVGPEIPVAVCVRPSLEVLVAMLAIWKARGIYLPLDPTHPEALIARMLDEARPRLVLTSSALSGLTGRFPQLCFDTDAWLVEKQPTMAPAIETGAVTLTDPAYLFYTSGTTGKAKGVVATQANLAQYIRSARQKYGFCADDVFPSLARYTFSISLFELVSPLCCGGSLRILDRDEILSPERLLRALEDVTVLHAGPSLLGSLFRYLHATPAAPRSLRRMRHASSGGDMVAPSVMEEMKRVFPNAELFVIYGCTEISCMGTTFPLPRETKVTRTFVGQPFPGVALRVLDPNRNLVPFGVVGEICFGGRGIVRGYLDRPELTAEKFVEIDGQRFYRTGDMGRLHPGGHLEILGRRDFQVQLRGIRIELTGIERTVQDLGLAAQCAVVAKTLDEGDVRLVAFVVKPSSDDVASFRRALAAELPDYMLPHHVVVLDAMPLTVNGKLDRNRLKEMPWARQLGSGEATRPASDRERRIAEVFANVLGVDEVGVEDGFFDRGGDSLSGVVALELIERAIGVAIPPHVLFEKGTVRALASYTQTADLDEARPILLNGQPSAPPLFMLSGIHIYRELARRLEGRCSAYGVFARREVGAFDPASGVHAVEDLARDYVAIIRRQQPLGPYRLLGYSFAGLVAYEVAQQLRAAGEEVRLLALVDAVLPEWTSGFRFRLSQLARLRSASAGDVVAFVARRLREKLGSPHAEFMRYREDARLGPLEERREAVNRDAASRYMPRIRPFPGHATLIASGERLRADPLKSPSCGWSPHIRSLDVHTIDADHFRLMSDDPYVSEMADVLARQMQQVDARARDLGLRHRA